MKKIYKGTISILLATVMMVSLCIGVLATSTTISIQFNQQYESNLCWAACSTTIYNFFNPVNTKTQTRIVIDALGSYQNSTQSTSKVYENFFGNASYGFRSTEGYSTISYSDIRQQIENSNKPIFVGTNKKQATGTSGHAIVIYRTDITAGINYVGYMDPLTGQGYLDAYTNMDRARNVVGSLFMTSYIKDIIKI